MSFGENRYAVSNARDGLDVLKGSSRRGASFLKELCRTYWRAAPAAPSRQDLQIPYPLPLA